MHRTIPVLTRLGVTCLLLAAAQARADSPQSARAVLDTAVTRAKAEHKPIFLHFSASW